MPWWRAFVVWVLMAAVEVFHGALRRLYLVPVVGDWRARQVGAVIGAVLVFVIALITIRWVGATSRRALLQTGVFWLLLMVSFEMLGGRLAGYTWARIGSDYDLRYGGLLGLGMVVVALAPLLAARLRPSPRPS
jgi:hypothetical protein